MRRNRLPQCIAAFFVLSAPLAQATTFVTNCNDAGPDSLRAALTNAVESDTVDATGLAGICSTITLATGSIVIGVDNLTVLGPGVTTLNVRQSGSDRIFTHNGTGLLTVTDMELSHGYAYAYATDANGGCIYSKGSVSVDHSLVYDCLARTVSGRASGGGIFTRGATTVTYSTIRSNYALAVDTDGAGSGPVTGGGGGIESYGDFTALYTTIVHNAAFNNAQTSGIGGGVFALGTTVVISGTTLAGNFAGDAAGGIVSAGGTFRMVNSTVSGNGAGRVGGVYSEALHTYVYNSTIAFNTSGSGTVAAGLQILQTFGTAILESTLISDNTYGAAHFANDFYTSPFNSFTGNNNLIGVSHTFLPPDTIVGTCALLAPLADNGGLTFTHRLRSGSPAINAGNNTGASAFDQRGGHLANGVRDYPRVSGPPGGTAVADIGAFEVDQSDAIYDASFEGCP